MIDTIHENQPVLRQGVSIDDAQQAFILLHGRGSSPEQMLPLAKLFIDDKTALIIPRASGNRWYPQTAFGPLEDNEPDLSSALNTIEIFVDQSIKIGIPRKRIYLGGFSQGACLAAEFAARNPGRYGGLFILSGALIGPPDQKREVVGSLQDTPVFIGCSDSDLWIPHGLVQETAAFFKAADAAVDLRIYPGMGHTVNEDEISAVKDILSR